MPIPLLSATQWPGESISGFEKAVVSLLRGTAVKNDEEELARPTEKAHATEVNGGQFRLAGRGTPGEGLQTEQNFGAGESKLIVVDVRIEGVLKLSPGHHLSLRSK